MCEFCCLFTSQALWDAFNFIAINDFNNIPGSKQGSNTNRNEDDANESECGYNPFWCENWLASWKLLLSKLRVLGSLRIPPWSRRIGRSGRSRCRCSSRTHRDRHQTEILDMMMVGVIEIIWEEIFSYYFTSSKK